MNAILELIEVLEEIAGQVRRREERALAALQEPRDEKKYLQELEEKTALLARLTELVEAPLRGLPAALSEECFAALDEMAADARQAGTIGSPFYMSVLLYSTEQQQGDPNDLEQLILWLRQKA